MYPYGKVSAIIYLPPHHEEIHKTFKQNHRVQYKIKMNPRVCAISAAGFCNTCSSVRQRKPWG